MGGRIIQVGGQTIEGTASEVAVAVSEQIVTPVAVQIARAMDLEATAEFYTALVTHLLCNVATVFGAEMAEHMANAAARNAKLLLAHHAEQAAKASH